MDYKITIKDLVQLYAEQNELTPELAQLNYDLGFTTNMDLLESWLVNEGLIGYRFAIWQIFKAFTTTPHRLLSAGLWISVAERLPEKDGEYIVMIDGASKPTSLFFDENGFFGDSPFFADIYPFPDSLPDDPRVYYHVTHWMPFPASPVL